MPASSFELRPSQIEAARLIGSQPSTLLLWDMGTGKTRTTLVAYSREKLLNGAGPLVVVAPGRVVQTDVWEDDAARWAIPLTFAKVVGSPKVRREAAARAVDVYLTTFDVLHTAEVQELLIRAAKCGGWLVIDEISMIKSFGRRVKSIRPSKSKGRPLFSKMVGLTGTPVPNRERDLFYPVGLLTDWKVWGKNKQTWLNERFHTTDRHGYIFEPDDAESLYRDMAFLVHRNENTDLPPVVPHHVKVPRTEALAHPYAEMAREYITKVRGETITAANAGVRSMKLRQLCSGFMYDAAGQAHWIEEQRDARLNTLRALCDEIDSPVLILCEWQEDRDLVRGAFNDARTLDEPGIVKAWNRGDVGKLVMHPKSGGHGLNLQFGGNHVIWYTLPWSLELWRQVNARLARPGQVADHVLAHVLGVERTIEQRMFATLCEKGESEDALLDWFTGR